MFTKRLRNTSGRTIKFVIKGDPNMPHYPYEVKPGEDVDLPAGYCPPHSKFVESRARGLVLIEDLPEVRAARLAEQAAKAKMEAERIAAEADRAALAALEAKEAAEKRAAEKAAAEKESAERASKLSKSAFTGKGKSE